MELVARLNKGNGRSWQWIGAKDGRTAAHIWGTVEEYHWTKTGRALITVRDTSGMLVFLWAEVVIIDYRPEGA